MIGQYQHNIDAKGRLFIPAKFREELGETFYVTIGLDGCLSVYSDTKWAALTEKFEALPISKARSMRVLFANAAALRVAQAVGQLSVIAFGPMDPYPTGAQLFGNSLKEKRISHPDLEHDYEVTSEPTDWKGLPATLYYLLPVLG